MTQERQTYKIALVPGDGIGPEVAAAARLVLETSVAEAGKLTFETVPAGAGTYLETGSALPPDTLAVCRAADAVLHGAAGLPDVQFPDGTEAGQDFSMKIRSALDLYANIRPIQLIQGAPLRLSDKQPTDIDFTIVRENTEGLYASRGGGTNLREEVVTDTLVMTRKGIERIAHTAAKTAMASNGAPFDGVKRVSIVDKANVLRSYAFFRQVCDEVLAEYEDIEVDHVIVDAMTVHMIERPERFNVVVCENIFGDILSDLGAAIMGGMGLAPSAEIGGAHGMFQGSHGSAPDIAGQGNANPVACILSGAMMLDWLGRTQGDPSLTGAAARIRTATETVLTEGLSTTSDLGGAASTEACAEAICQALRHPVP